VLFLSCNQVYVMLSSDIDKSLGKLNTKYNFFSSYKKIGLIMPFQVNAYLILIVQFLVSVGASFMFGYLAPYYVSGLAEVGPRLLIGVLVAFVVGIADLYFVIRQMLDDDGIRLAKKVD
jgi:hypothetical protein